MAARATGRLRPARARWLALSLLLHALLVVIASRRVLSDRTVPPAATPGDELEIETTPEVAQAPAATAPSDAEPSAATPAPRAGTAPRASAPLMAPTSSDEAVADALAPGAPGEDAAATGAAASSAAPHLSLAQLGVDGSNPFIDRADPAAVKAARAARVKQRLDRALAQGTLNQESAAGRGSASPVLRAIEGAVYASNVPLNAQATFSFVIDSSGKLVSSSLGEATGDRTTWLRVAHETARALAGRTLVVPKGKSVRLTLAVTSHLELPSGADPGVEVDVLGIPIKKGAGPRSTKLDILNPRNGLVPLSLLGDPADAAARPRRMVHAHVVSEELL